MTSVMSVRIPDETKSIMKSLEDRIDWNSEIRQFIDLKIRDIRKREVVNTFINDSRNQLSVPEGTSVSLVREIRDRT